MSGNDDPENQQKSESAERPVKNEIIQSLVSELHAFKEQQHTDSETNRTSENRRHHWNEATTVGVWLYTFLTLGIVLISICQMRQSERNAIQQHNDTIAAIKQAASSALQQHSDTLDALNRGDRNAATQHGDTEKALAEAAKANEIARATYDAANRPYVGLNKISTEFMDIDNKTKTEQPTANTMSIMVYVEIKNFGPVPGTEFTSQSIWLIDGKSLDQIEIPEKPSIIYPTQTEFKNGRINLPDSRPIMAGLKTFQIDTWVDYRGPGGHYRTCQRQQYQPIVYGFADLGLSCDPKFEPKSSRANH